MTKEIQEVVEKGFAGKNVIVIGDLMLDTYLIGNITRVSPEAPVPVVQLHDEMQTLGGAGNVALNLQGLGVDVNLISTIGRDTEGQIIEQMLTQKKLSCDYVTADPEKPTITKTRVIGEHQQIVRVDREKIKPISESLQQKIIKQFESLIAGQSIDAVIISDYAKGVITETVCRSIIERAELKDIPVLVDPKEKNFDKYRNATMIMPNEQELSEACGQDCEDEDNLRRAGRQLHKDLEIDYLVVTRGEKGLLLIGDDYEHSIPTRAREVYDVSGAGDTVIALATAGLASSLSVEKSLELANTAAGYVVSKFGTHPIKRNELHAVIHRQQPFDQKLFVNGTIKHKLDHWSQNHQHVVFTNGCFDIIHAGHIHLLKEAKKQGDQLIVGINTDESVQGLKGQDRPVNTLEDRIRVLEAISYVDGIIPFSEPTPLELIRKVQPDVLVKGADYEEEDIVGAEEVKASGGRIVRIPIIEGKSTSTLIKQSSVTDGR